VSPSAAPVFYFGAMSPYSWFAAERIEQLLPAARWRGVLAGALFKQSGRVSWGLTQRRAGGIADCNARAAKHGLGPIEWPDPWPTSDLLVARAMAFCEHATTQRQSGSATDALATSGGAGGGDDLLKAYGLAAMRLAFREGADLGELDAVLEAGRRAGLDEHELRDGIQDPAVKDTLRAVTDEALAAGVFGVPTVLLAKTQFWGDDRLEDAAAAFRASDAGGNGVSAI
jgi:2-hydroxychromene-2-carboxylate isomerase